MSMLHIEFQTPLNSAFGKCIGESEISSKIPTRKSSTKTFRIDLQVGDVILGAKSPRRGDSSEILVRDEVRRINSLKGAEI